MSIRLNSGDWRYKIVLLGESAVGKSSVVLRLTKNQFKDNDESTIGAAFLTHTTTISTGDGESDIVKFELWDTAGQERYSALAPMYYRGAKAAIVVYDITSSYSFERAKKWVKDLKNHNNSLNVNISNCVIVLIGNKVDLEDKREVDTQIVERYAKDEDLMFFEASAKTGYHVFDIFKQIGETLHKNHPPLPLSAASIIQIENNTGSRCNC